MWQIEMMWWRGCMSLCAEMRCCLSGECPWWWLSPGEKSWDSCGSRVFRLECWQVYYWSLFFFFSPHCFLLWTGGATVRSSPSSSVVSFLRGKSAVSIPAGLMPLVCHSHFSTPGGDILRQQELNCLMFYILFLLLKFWSILLYKMQ